MKAEVFFADLEGGVPTTTMMAVVDLGGDHGIEDALEYVYRVTQNIQGSWSKGEFFENGERNPDFNEAIDVIEPLVKDFWGDVLGHRSMMVGDWIHLIAANGGNIGWWRVAPIGFKEEI
jgi:hypothetical protein